MRIDHLNRNVAPARRLDFKKKILFAALVAGIALFACYGARIIWLSGTQYGTESRWVGKAYAYHETFGYFPRQNVETQHSLPGGQPYAIAFDDSGFRVSSLNQRDDTDDTDDTDDEFQILFLGCSFTQGFGLPAEQTFSHIAAKQLDAIPLNAGVTGWGLSQMVLRARDVIPKLKPDLVVAQYSNWLPSRSVKLFSQATWGKSPVPYFYEAEGVVDIHKPVFDAIKFKLPIAEYSERGFLPFVWKVGLPLIVHDDYQALATFVKQNLGVCPSPTTQNRAVDYAYHEIKKMCEIYGSEMIILQLPLDHDDYPADYAAFPNVQVVSALEPLLNNLSERTREAWEAKYCIWSDTDPPQIINRHPNAIMNAEIARILVDAIRDNKTKVTQVSHIKAQDIVNSNHPRNDQ